jgi:hypothetical protein
MREEKAMEFAIKVAESYKALNREYIMVYSDEEFAKARKIVAEGLIAGIKKQ